MPEFFAFGLKIGFLALLWLFILFIGSFVRTDLFGRKLSPAELEAAGQGPAKPVSRAQRRAEKKLPKTLTVTHGPQAGTTLTLGSGLAIGRSSDCQLILDDDYVSTRHARIVRGGDGYVVEDLGSTNGTFVNNQRITAPTTFGLGDTLRIGRTTMSLDK